MAKKKINYQNTVIYKICCDDTEEFYIGSTTDFTRRKSQHKSACNNENNKNHTSKIYQTIREYGGWDNWRMVVVEEYPCENKREAEKREEEIRMELKTTFNSVRDDKCSVNGCETYAKKSGMCITHGAKVKKRCSTDGCEKQAQKGGLCVKHGAKVKRCSVDGCEKGAVKGGVCISHGAKFKRCSVNGCENQSVKGGVCVTHGAKVKHTRCSADGCDNYVQKGGMCRTHGAKYTCIICNATLSALSQKAHEKSKKHLNNLENV